MSTYCVNKYNTSIAEKFTNSYILFLVRVRHNRMFKGSSGSSGSSGDMANDKRTDYMSKPFTGPYELLNETVEIYMSNNLCP